MTVFLTHEEVGLVIDFLPNVGVPGVRLNKVVEVVRPGRKRLVTTAYKGTPTGARLALKLTNWTKEDEKITYRGNRMETKHRP